MKHDRQPQSTLPSHISPVPDDLSAAFEPGGMFETCSRPIVVTEASDVESFLNGHIHGAVPIVLRDAMSMFGIPLDTVCLRHLEETGTVVTPSDHATGQKVDEMSLTHFLEFSRRQDRESKLYAKDISVPEDVMTAISERVPLFIRHMGQYDIASAVPAEYHVRTNLMYIGGSGTGTPGHFDFCGSIGVNLMCSDVSNAKALWVVFDGNNPYEATRIWHKEGLHLHDDNHFLPLNIAVANGAYVFVQNPGDMVIIPSDAAHQVMNIGDPSLKIAWNLTTPITLERAVRHILPRYSTFRKPEVYRSKAQVMYAVAELTDLCNRIADNSSTYTRRYQRPFSGELNRDPFERYQMDEIYATFGQLLRLYEAILDDEFTEPHNGNQPTQITQAAGALACDFCRTDIFNRAWKCSACHVELCCACVSNMRTCKSHPDKMVSIIQYTRDSLYGLLETAKTSLVVLGAKQPP
ncbi:hypothetical protein HDU93_002293 [Gonapodya sp. JEL0774]|nr:hypothetical protein HDU93_002293 [Gonapodya sp. JEL0774]